MRLVEHYYTRNLAASGEQRETWDRSVHELRRELRWAFVTSFGGSIDEGGEWSPWDEDEAAADNLAVAAMFGMRLPT